MQGGESAKFEGKIKVAAVPYFVAYQVKTVFENEGSKNWGVAVLPT